jgi:hypothetical protein
MVINPHGALPETRVLRTKALGVSSGFVDVADNALVVDYTGPSPLASVAALVAGGYAGGSWNGVGVRSSQAASRPGFGVGLAEAADVFAGFPASFLGHSVDNSTLLLRFTRYGDASLDGTVNLLDFNRLAANFGQSNRFWQHGDFNYDGQVNLPDFNRLAANFGLSASGTDITPQDWANLAAAVPEPGAGAIVVALTTLIGRRRRQGTRDV